MKPNSQIDLMILQKLRNLFIQKIDQEWHLKWVRYSPTFQGFEKLTSLNAFLEDLLEDIELTLKPKLGLKLTASILISKDSLRRFIQASQLGALKGKTRHTIAYYLGYDGWDDFLEKNYPTLEEIASAETTTLNQENTYKNNLEESEESSNTKSKTQTSLYRSIVDNGKYLALATLLSVLVIGFILGLKLMRAKGESIVFQLDSIAESNFPTVAKIKYNIGELNASEITFKQHNEPLDWYLKRDTKTYSINHSNGTQVIHCDKPGLHHLEMVYQGINLDTVDFVIKSKDWFGIAYAKDKNAPNEYVFTNTSDWNELIKANNQKIKLAIPPHFLDNYQADSRYRADFFYSGNINIDADELCMEVDFFSVPEIQSFDCKYFQMGFVETYSYNSIYLPISTCATEGQVKVGRWENPNYYPNQLKDIMNVDTKQANHSAKFYFKNKKIFVELDGSLRYEKAYNIDLGKVEVFNISLNGESYVKRFTVKNTTNDQVVYSQSFEK
jgi:hypothetical protein